jgi:ferredoxin-NADP reductase
MEESLVKILKIAQLTTDIRQFTIAKPEEYKFSAGQVTLLAINNSEWKDKKRPFTFASLNSAPELEFIIKSYPEHHGVTEQMGMLKVGDELTIGKPYGTMHYAGIGTFIAGGVGITPFLAIFRQLKSEGKFDGNALLYSNRTQAEIVFETELKELFAGTPDKLVFTLTREEKEGYESGRIDETFLRKHVKDFGQNFYVCGPPPFVQAITETLKTLGASADKIQFEGQSE